LTWHFLRAGHGYDLRITDPPGHWVDPAGGIPDSTHTQSKIRDWFTGTRLRDAPHGLVFKEIRQSIDIFLRWTRPDSPLENFSAGRAEGCPHYSQNDHMP
jgi:hypothetical protein